MSETSRDLLTPLTLQSYLEEAFLRFYETAYEVRDQGVRDERRSLLSAPGSAFTEPLLELLPRYQSAATSMADIATELGVPEAGELVRAGLLSHEHPYSHQELALRSSDAGRDVIVGTGTGSGKTEAFLLPVLMDLVRESRDWAPGTPATTAQARWWQGKNPFVPQREGEVGRDPGVRALLLYPMNALVEDQLIRLRQALDSPAARDWFGTHRPGHRFYFGRYTGRTPVPGPRATATAGRVNRLRSLMKDSDRRHEQLLRRITEGAISDSDARYFLPALDGAEMRSRWDMQDRAPDILITNYSMLSIALSRSDEQGMIQQTRRWLDGGEGRRFTLVVDELHMYRGTAGTEVAYLLRRLFHALGLDQNPERLRIIGTSASIVDDEEGRQFLREMFGRPGTHAFDFVRSSTDVPSGADDLGSWVTALASRDDNRQKVTPSDDDVIRALSNALTTGGQVRPARLSAVAERLFPGTPADDASQALEGLVQHVARQEQPAVRLRGHFFARTLQGLWACVRPDCPEVEDQYRSAGRRIGKIYASARLTCECGSRVLELLYCQSCGESMLGGYVALSRTRQFLIPTTAELDDLPDHAPSQRDASNYRVYWPTDRSPVVKPWERTGTRLPDDTKAPLYKMGFVRAVLKPGTGQLSVTGQESTGVVFRLQSGGGAEARMPAFPTKCPSCGDDWEYRGPGGVEDRRKSGSPIRTQGVGFDRANQVLTGALKRRLDSSLVVFSDSRQGAARVAANLELAHYLDLVRALVLEALSGTDGSLALAEAFLRRTDLSDEAKAAYSALKAEAPEAAMALRERVDGMPLTKSEEDALHALAQRDAGSLNLVEVVNRIGPRLLDVGVNPAGPAPSMEATRSGRPWSMLYDWEASPVRVRPNLDHECRELLAKIEAALGTQVIRTVFAGGDRDVESLGIARAVPSAPFRPAGVPADVADQVASSLIRIVGRRRRTIWTNDGGNSWPSLARGYADAVVQAAKLPMTGDDLLDAFTTHMKAAPASFRLVPESVRLELAAEDDIWRCSTCRTRHLHRSAGVCIACLRPVTESEPRSEIDEAYYTWLATQDGGIYRLHCEELTGQTDAQEAQARQARFQGVLVQDQDARPEVDVVDTVDILSVTTTMEAGVDIGALKGVVMANMPPQRFNYQQRVGRAGRRSSHFSAALTVCRGARSHDEHYFAHPESITGDDPPQPFLDTSSVSILRRAFAAEVLTRVFRRCETEVVGFDPGRSVHGQFGAVEVWRDSTDLRSFVRGALRDTRDDWVQLATSLLREARATVSGEELATWAAADLATLIDQTVASARVRDLSEALAQHGVLPMFGFPTTTRVLFTSWPKGSEQDALDRDAPIALSEFAPGAELVKDKQIHTAVGVVDLRQRADGSWYEGDAPLSDRRTVGVCRSCLAFSDDPGASCGVCGETEPKYAVMDTAEPAGYRTSFKPRDYEQLGDPTARASQPRMTVGPVQYLERGENALVRSANTEIVSVNDNRGSLFTFVRGSSTYEGRKRDEAGLLAADLLKGERRQQVGLRYVNTDGDVLEPVALAARRRTDVLSLGAATLPAGLAIDPRLPAGRGAWGSLGFLIRDAAAKWLDIGSDEMEVGVHPVAHGSTVRGEVFIADSLENGAGYATRLFDRFEDLLDVADEHAARLGKHGRPPCDSSCYLCLRDYSNRSWHALLDWRLGVDLLDLIRGRSIDLERHVDRDVRAARAIAEDCGFEVDDIELPTIVGRRGTALAVTHPFESIRSEDESERVRAVRSRYPDALFTSSFEMLRRPGALLASLMA